MNVKKNLLYILFALIAKSGFAQDPQFSQFYANPLYQSPSFAGAVKGYRVTGNYRNQWPQLSGKIETYSAGVDANISPINSGLGIVMMRDVIGSTRYATTNVGLLYSYNVKINRKVYFRPGVGFYYSQYSIDYASMYFSSQIDADDGTGTPVSPVLEDEFNNLNSVDGSVSGLFLTQNWWAGFTVDHLFRPNTSFTDYENRLPMKYTLYGGYRFRKVERLISAKRQTVTVTGTYRHQDAFDQFDIGLYWSYDPIILGVWYRDLPLVKDFSRRDAVIFLVGAKIEDFSVGYSYDFTVSKLITSTGGAHEIAVSYRFEVEQKKKFKKLPCPEF